MLSNLWGFVSPNYRPKQLKIESKQRQMKWKIEDKRRTKNRNEMKNRKLHQSKMFLLSFCIQSTPNEEKKKEKRSGNKSESNEPLYLFCVFEMEFHRFARVLFFIAPMPTGSVSSFPCILQSSSLMEWIESNKDADIATHCISIDVIACFSASKYLWMMSNWHTRNSIFHSFWSNELMIDRAPLQNWKFQCDKFLFR